MIEDSEKNNIVDYNGSKFNKLENLIPFVLVTGGGRSGTDFLQSLLDSHEQVLSYNGHLKLYIEFFTNSKCIKSGSFNLIDIAHEFVGLYIERFNSKYDYLEIYIKTDQKILYSRDPKDIYKNYLDGKTKNVVGEDIPFQEPVEPWMTIDNNSENNSIEIIDSIVLKLKKMNIIL